MSSTARRPNLPAKSRQWQRAVDQGLNSAQAALARQGRQLAGIRNPVDGEKYAYLAPAITGTIGVTTGWQRLATDTGPNVKVYTPNGLLRVEVGACLESNWTNTAINVQTFMGMTVSVNDPFDPSDPTLGDKVRGGIMATFAHATGQPAARAFAYSRVLWIPVQPDTEYTLRAEYLFNNQTAGIQAQWSQRSVSVKGL